MRFQVGVARVDTTPDGLGMGMLGWGDDAHRVQGVKRPLHTRVAVLRAGLTGTRLIFACIEICFVTEALRAAVLEQLAALHPELAVRDEELLLSATHVHNAPGGHSKYLLYNLTIPGFQPRILEAYTDGVVRAIAEACGTMKPAQVRMSSGHFAPDSKVAFNRSLEAWRQNPDAQEGEEIDREMVLLRFDGEDGRPLGCVNWFPVHATSIHRDFPYIHSDNKGVAADILEEDARGKGHTGFVSVFAQGAAGDVTPNFVKHAGLRDLRGPFRDDEKSCEFNAHLQATLARKLYEDAARAAPLTGEIESVIERHDFSRIEVDAEFAGGRQGVRTSPGVIGCNMLRGTAEGRGGPGWLILLGVLMSRATTYLRYFGIILRGKKIKPPWHLDASQGCKIAFMESGRGRIFGISRLAGFFVPSFFHPTIRNLKLMARDPVTSRAPFTPQILPLQFVRLGPLALIAVPAELTTVAGRRLRDTVADRIRERGFERVILCGYANAYAGYVATCEEYQLQHYEGASTHFGMWTLAGYQTAFSQLCRRMFVQQRGIQMPAAQPGVTNT
ncbi:MAG: neutral/alkaline non-lysosomal ceramidase N-terminal domain-containing protein [Deltaproteobacteria bacterium]|nr:neutral/alkaline non-lysosomal ceramidase N-terminal domain-containing protein [Deltaproteobacteria bacterium]